MRIPTIPRDEARRLASLEALNVLFTPNEERFDRITRCATRLLDTPIALVSLVGANEQWFKSAQGYTGSGTPRSTSFCGHAILAEDQLVVSDALLDERFADNPLVVGEPYIRAYAGQPLHGVDGQRVGSVCVIDQRPRDFSPAELEVLRDLGRWVESELHSTELSASQQDLIREVETLRRTALIDRLTHTWNRGAIDDVLEREMERARRDGSPLSVVMLDLDHFKAINDGHGHPAGDEVLRETARRIRSALRPFDALGRYGGEEFLLVLSNCTPEQAERIGERVANALRDSPIELASGQQIEVTASLGVATGRPSAGNADTGEWIDRADQALYRAKKAGRDRIEIAAFTLQACAA